MANEVKQVHDEMKQLFGQVPGWVKEVPPAGIGGLWSLLRDFEFAETAVPNKYKELIGIAVSGATRCRYCALFHTEGAKLNGATDQEIAEASMMAAVTMAGSTFLNAQQTDYDAFRRETLEMVEFARAHAAAQPTAGVRPEATAHA